MEFIETHEIRKSYELGEIGVPVLQGVSLKISRGEFVAIMGVSGSGKTTLMNILGCLDRPTSGKYHLEGMDIAALSNDERAQIRNRKIGFVFQNFNLLPRTSAIDNIIMPSTYSPDPPSDNDTHRRAEHLLQRMGLFEQMRNEPSQLSGGQQQRVAIARALINRPSLLFADEPTGNLDSQTSEEVLRTFRQLNEEEGVTIILVTHDLYVAKTANRIIRISDGRIESEDMLQELPSGQTFPEEKDIARRPVKSRLQAGRTLMTALSGLRRNVMRAALTTLGIIIGVSAVIAMMEIGRGSSTAIRETIASMGANTLAVLPGTAASGGVSRGAGSRLTLRPEDGEAILKGAPAVRAVAIIERARTQIVFGNRNWVPHYIYGTTRSFLDVREWSIAEGDMFTDHDVRNATKVCVLGQRLVEELFPGESPVGKEVRIHNVPFKIIGVLAAKGANMMGTDQDDIVLAPWTTIKFRVVGSSLGSVNQSATEPSLEQKTNSLSQTYPSTGNNLYSEPTQAQKNNNPFSVKFHSIDQILTAVHTADDIPAAMQQITGVLRERHRIRPGEPDDFRIRDMAEMTKALSSTVMMTTKLLLAVALISLLVGGVGIMNIMLVSVTERTREIGLRMAVGARSGEVLKQFLFESLLLGL
ncbi:MAG: ABC transporter permease, partial [Syntrophobacteraceae bacterium]